MIKRHASLLLLAVCSIILSLNGCSNTSTAESTEAPILVDNDIDNDINSLIKQGIFSIEPTTTAPTYIGNIHTLHQSELNDIASRYSAQSNGYGANSPGRDENNRNLYVLSKQEELSGLNTRFFGTTSSKTIYFAFSCGWENAPNTEQILQILEQHQIKAVFFVTHEYACNNPDLVQAIIDAGHEIGNHSYSHPQNGLPSLSLKEQMEDTMKMQKYIYEHFGYTMKKYNFPSSQWSEQSTALLSQMGYEVCFYSFNYSDFDNSVLKDTTAIVENMVNSLTPGCIYYLHPVYNRNPEAISQFISQALAQGYTFGVLP